MCILEDMSFRVQVSCLEAEYHLVGRCSLVGRSCQARVSFRVLVWLL